MYLYICVSDGSVLSLIVSWSSLVGWLFHLFPLTVILSQNELDHQASHCLGIPSFHKCRQQVISQGKGDKTHKNRCSYLLTIEECKLFLYNIIENAIEITAVVLTMSAAVAMLCDIPVGERTLVTMAIQLENICNHGNRI